MPERAGKVYLVGSGPGDAAYLTLQAQAVLARAEVLVYDALVDGDLIEFVPDPCLKLDVGKRGGQPSTPQSEINQILVDYCRQGKLVVRLKNGDPFIFGRVQSEIGALKRANCEFEVIPGLSSALMAPLMAGIPLTDPRLSSGFTVLTAHQPDILNWVSLAKLETLVFLMGGRTLPEIVRRLRGHGRSPETPIAVIRYAGRDRQQVWEGTLSDILDITANQPLAPCVIVIGDVVRLRAYIGEQRMSRPSAAIAVDDLPRPTPEILTAEPVVEPGIAAVDPTDRATRQPADRPRYRAELEPPVGGEESGWPANRPRDRRWDSEPSSGISGFSPEPPLTAEFEPIAPQPEPPEIPPDVLSPAMPAPIYSGPLAHKTVLVTRAASQSSQFTTMLEEQGATVVEMPTLEIGPPSSWRDLDRAIAHLEDFEWLILSSTNGVDYFFERLEAVTGERTFATNIKVAVVGEKTANRLRQMGIPADFVPPDFVADSLVANFPEPLSGLRILFPRVESGGREVLVKEFTNQGAKVKEVAAYESYCPAAIAPPILVALQAKAINVITFASSKTVRNFCQLLQAADPNWPTWIENACIASIGPQTSEHCERLLGRVDVEATEYTLEGLTEAIAAWATAEPAAIAKPNAEGESAAVESSPSAAPADGSDQTASAPETAPSPETGRTVGMDASTPAAIASEAEPILELEIVPSEPEPPTEAAIANGGAGQERPARPTRVNLNTVIDLEIVSESTDQPARAEPAEMTAIPDPWLTEEDANPQTPPVPPVDVTPANPADLSSAVDFIAHELETVEQLLQDAAPPAPAEPRSPLSSNDDILTSDAASPGIPEPNSDPEKPLQSEPEI